MHSFTEIVQLCYSVLVRIVEILHNYIAEAAKNLIRFDPFVTMRLIVDT